MHFNGAPSWEVRLNPSRELCFALYLRDCASLETAGVPPVSALKPAVRCADPRQTVRADGGLAALRVEWEAWWFELTSGHGRNGEFPQPPDFPQLNGMPALQRFTHAHFGTALAWVEEWEAARLERAHGDGIDHGHREQFAKLVEERELELGRAARHFSLEVAELPLSEARAWFVEPHMLIVSEDLYDDEDAFRSYVQPVIEIIA